MVPSDLAMRRAVLLAGVHHGMKPGMDGLAAGSVGRADGTQTRDADDLPLGWVRFQTRGWFKLDVFWAVSLGLVGGIGGMTVL
ncbi:unnamed protein product [Laminaria digitata]|tara:strand:+ start:647 stop:895 length:249 start_codon:yes stop_codon:yes gene_type:complete